MVSHVIFDFDGTLVNSIDRIIEVVDQTIQQKNPNLRINDKIKDYVPNLTSFQNLVALINSELGLTLDPDEYAAYFGHEARLKLNFMPGVVKLITHLHAHGIPMAIATGAGRKNFEVGLSNHPEFYATYIRHSVCAFDDPDVKNRKPAPDCYHIASQRFSPPPTDMSKVLIFEDSITGLKGATASGGRTVFVSKWKSMFAEENQPLIQKAELVIGSIEEFKPEQFGLPPYKD